jgi:hypothetical protein
VGLPLRDPGPLARGPTAPASTVTFTAVGVGACRLGDSAVAINVTATGAVAPGFVQVFPAGGGVPGATSTLDVDHAGQTVASLGIVGVDSAGRVSVYTQSSTQLVVDVLGCYGRTTGSVTGRLIPVDPVRVLDTRTGVGAGGATTPIRPGGSVDVHVPYSVVPLAEFGVVLTLTATETRAPGYIQVLPLRGTTRVGATSNLNIDRVGETVANTVIVPLRLNNTFTIFSQSGAHVVADVVGFISGTFRVGNLNQGLLVPIPPRRLADSRTARSPFAAGATFTIPVAGRRPLPAVAPTAIAGTITATNTTAAGYVQMIPTGSPTAIGATSSLNINGPHRTVAAATVVAARNPFAATSNGLVTVHTQRATDIVYDVTGYFT